MQDAGHSERIGFALRAAPPMMPASPTADWSVTIVEQGRCGRVDYREGGRVIRLYWEFGGGDVIAIVSGPLPDAWDSEHPWARGRAREILLRVAGEVVRQRAPGREFELDEARTAVYILAS